MTRPTGKLLKASTLPIVEKKGVLPEETLKYRIYSYIKRAKKPLTTKEIHLGVAVTSPRRSVEKRLLDLTNDGSIKRDQCTCGCSFLYTI